MPKSVIKSVSITTEQAKYIEENPPLSLSNILQTGIENIKANRKHFEDKIRLLNARNEILQQKLFESNEFITEKGLWEDFKKSVLEKEKRSREWGI